MKRLAVITTHPIQYNAPLFRLLSLRENIDIKVFYTWGDSVLKKKYDPGFKRVIDWDIPLLDGYQYVFAENKSSDPGSHHFFGIDCGNLIELVNNYLPDVILVYGWSYKSHLKLLLHYKTKVPIIFRGDSTLTDNDGNWIKTSLRRVFLNWVYKYIDYAFYTGSNNYAYFRHAGVQPDRLLHAPHCVDNERFLPDTISREKASKLRQSLNIAEDAVVLLFAGKLERKKDPGILLEVFIENRFYDRSVLVLTGNGTLERELRTRAIGYPNIHFIEFQNQSHMPEVYQAADIFILPSVGPGETWGLAINESMASGCAVICSDKCGGAVDLIDQGKNGYIFASGDKLELKVCIERLLGNPILLREMKSFSLKKIEEFSLSRFAFEIESLVNSL